MSTAQKSSLPLPSSCKGPGTSSIQTPPQPANDSRRIIFTRQLWQRTMPDEIQSDQSVLNRSHSQDPSNVLNIAAGPIRRSSSVSSRSRRNSPTTASRSSKAPLTPEESPPTRTNRKRNTGIVEQEDQDLHQIEVGLAHSRANSDDSNHVCICQPDPKIPRPRNAFILYRQHHQANVISQHPGLSNPEISKIIGEQWQNQPPEIKGKWKALAEEEKLRHQAQYPTYRYQPKRSGRRGSLSFDGVSSAIEKAKCAKCGGKSILAPSAPFSHSHSASTSPSGPQTLSSALTPISRTLPVLRDLSLQSPALRRTGRLFLDDSMSPGHHLEDRDELGPLSPDAKRRRFNGDHQPTTFSRVMAPRYANAPQQIVSVGPGTPFPFPQQPPHPYPPGANAPHVRRESLPGLRGMASPPGAMPPPPRPITGYQQHRLSQGHVSHDRSLTLPPLQTNSVGGGGGPPSSASTVTPASGKSATDQIMNMEFWHKVRVLNQVAPPTPVRKEAMRGPFVAIEGDDVESVREVAVWLSDTLSRGDDLNVKLLQGPTMRAEGGKQKIMAQYHRLTAEWLDKSGDIMESLAIKTESPTDTVMVDAAIALATGLATKTREIDECYDDSDSSSSPKATQDLAATNQDETERTNSDASSKIPIDSATTRASSISSRGRSRSIAKPVSVIANYSLHASNFFACHIPITAHDPYSPIDHWTWTATQWRGIISPDLTIYVRNAASSDTGKSNVDIMADGNLFAVKRTKAEGKDSMEIEPSVLRRLGFEVGEWVQAFGANAA